MIAARGDGLAGRTLELDRLRARLERAVAGEGSLILVAGEAGIGKSRLIRTWATEARAAGWLVAEGGCPVVSGASLPLAAPIEALRDVGRQIGAAELGVIAAAVAPVLLAWLPKRASAGTSSSAIEPTDTVLFEGFLSVIERAAEDRPGAVLLLEDLQWADRSTLELVAYLARNVRLLSLVVVATYRSDGLAAGHPLRAMAAELGREPSVETVDLLGLAPEVLEAWLRLTAPDIDGARIEAIVARADGNPSFAEALLATSADPADGPMAGLAARFELLDRPVLDLLRMAATAGRRFDLRVVAAAVRADEATIGPPLAEAIERRLIVPVGNGSSLDFEFRQGLARDVIEAGQTPLERRQRHRALARALAAADPDGRPELLRLAELAGHWVAAGEAAEAVPRLIDAGVAAEAAHAFSEAAASFDRALELWPEARPASPDRSFVEARAAEAHHLAGDERRARSLARGLIEAARGDAPAVRAAAAERLGRYLAVSGDHAAALSVVDEGIEGLDGVPPSALFTRLLTLRSRALLELGRLAEAEAAADEAVAAGEAAGATTEVHRARETRGVALAFGGHPEQALEVLADARRRAVERSGLSLVQPRPSRIGDVVRRFADMAVVLERAGQPGDARLVADEGAVLAAELGATTSWTSTLQLHRAIGEFRLGAWEEVERDTRDLLAGPPTPWRARVHLIRARLEVGRGQLADAAAHLAAARSQVAARPDIATIAELGAVAAELAIWHGQVAEARDAVERALRELAGGEDPAVAAELCWLGLRAEADRAAVARGRGRPAEIDEATTVGAPLAAQLAVLTADDARRVAAPRERRLYPALGAAELARLRGAAAADAWQAARVAADEARDPWLTAYAAWREAEALFGSRGDRGVASARLREAGAIATRLEARGLLGEVDALARRSRVSLDTAEAVAGPGAAAGNAFGLTAREVEVLGLMADGRTNCQIATSLFITEKTAGHHVSNVLSKLDAASRAEAAAIARRAGVVS